MNEFDDIVRRLREQRPELTELELDQVKQRARKRARNPRKGQSMRSRLAMLGMLVLGMMISTTGAGLALQGSSGNGNAAMQQYPLETPPGDVLGEEDEEDAGGVAGEREEAAPAPQPQPQPQPQVERQVEAGVDGAGGELPFTGLAAIPILLLGLALTVGGVAMRVRAGRRDG